MMKLDDMSRRSTYKKPPELEGSEMMKGEATNEFDEASENESELQSEVNIEVIKKEQPRQPAPGDEMLDVPLDKKPNPELTDSQVLLQNGTELDNLLQ